MAVQIKVSIDLRGGIGQVVNRRVHIDGNIRCELVVPGHTRSVVLLQVLGSRSTAEPLQEILLGAQLDPFHTFGNGGCLGCDGNGCKKHYQHHQHSK